jgi:hypothetical protein
MTDNLNLEAFTVACQRAALHELNDVLKNKREYISPEMLADAIACRDDLQARLNDRPFAGLRALFPDRDSSEVQIPRPVLIF